MLLSLRLTDIERFRDGVPSLCVTVSVKDSVIVSFFVMVNVSSSESDNVDDRRPSRDKDKVRDFDMADENVADAVAATRVSLRDKDRGECVRVNDDDGKDDGEYVGEREKLGDMEFEKRGDAVHVPVGELESELLAGLVGDSVHVNVPRVTLFRRETERLQVAEERDKEEVSDGVGVPGGVKVSVRLIVTVAKSVKLDVSFSVRENVSTSVCVDEAGSWVAETEMCDVSDGVNSPASVGVDVFVIVPLPLHEKLSTHV